MLINLHQNLISSKSNYTKHLFFFKRHILVQGDRKHRKNTKLENWKISSLQSFLFEKAKRFFFSPFFLLGENRWCIGPREPKTPTPTRRGGRCMPQHHRPHSPSRCLPRPPDEGRARSGLQSPLAPFCFLKEKAL